MSVLEMEKRPVRLHFDLNRLQAVSIQGIRRAAAFMAIGLNATRNPAQLSLSLKSASMWRFFPEPVPSELLVNSVEEFRIWTTGNALRELDAAFNTFLDQAWSMLQWAKLHNTSVKSDHRIETIEDDTNAANKYDRIFRELGDLVPDTAMLWTLSNLRNCLTHARGLVRERDAKVDGHLIVRWLALEVRLQQGEQYVIVPHHIEPSGLQAPDPSKPADVVGQVVQRQRSFAVGSVVSIEPADMHEICWFYSTLTDRVISGLSRYIIALGVPRADSLEKLDMNSTL